MTQDISRRNIVYRYVNVKTGLIKTRLPEYTYSINPYFGCSFACIYCYAIKYFYIKNIPYDWGTYVEIKVNLPDILKRELRRISLSNNDIIGIGVSTDPYQPIEAKVKITRKILDILVKREASISIQTKSPLVLRDIDLLKRSRNVDVGFTITTLNDELAKAIEPYAPKPSSRLKAIKKLSEQGIYTWIFIGPILPYLTDDEKSLREIVIQSYKARVNKIYTDNLRFRLGVRDSLLNFLRNYDSRLYYRYKNMTYNELFNLYRRAVNIVRDYAEAYNIEFEDVGYLPFSKSRSYRLDTF